MKKNIILLFMGIVLFACSNDDKVLDVQQETKGLVFDIAAKTQLTDTKSNGTPVYSQDASQSITRVSILAFKNNGTDYYYTKTYEISGWIAGSTFKSFTVPDADKLPEGRYNFLAIGRDATDLYQINPALSSTTKMGDITAAIALSGDEYELFSDTVQNDSVYAEGTRINLTMTRKIAGVLGYFKNVPQILNGQTVRYLRLTTNAGNKDVVVASGIGSSRDIGYDIINIDLSTQSVTDGIYTGNTTPAGVVKLANSQLAGAYMLPIDNLILTLGLYDENNIAIKTWQVSEGASTTFNILPNHFYSLGVKQKPDSTTGTNPTDPGDDDEAIDLLQDQVITITIDPAWNTIHPLVIQ
ncbi:FimB/Mfa2 family fimbrial subunit [Dysgonomonas sp. Marseille-P4677]|uniref:FimB/Mfa2 family fimbrial subunit n=1 Tax=Dysgonomonas sp. Marseille-P4677 TaxID=2364790 RepID=UPI00191487F3|nr:FimB/Mfa2 family fimbrial subunit [Dysgonomonas sp. Marseille-P4677]MBK5722937.1 FimB/Mfa2 family fimbrial subunit [Dysgonomonas sp. Marseille-P4677]